MARMTSDGDEYEEEEEKWSQWFCGLPGNEYFCEINPSYIEDSFNLYGLRAMVSNYQEALNIILDLTDIPYDDDVPSCAAELYGLIHARYIITSHGLDAMLKKYRDGDFGFCPRALCAGQHVVPAGMYDEPKKAEMKVYCPKCRDLYTPSDDFERTSIDGAYFGSTFPHLFFLTYANLEPPPSTELYVPRVFGYKIHKKGPNRHRLASTAPKALENGDQDTQELEGTQSTGNSQELMHGSTPASQLVDPDTNNEVENSSSAGIQNDDTPALNDNEDSEAQNLPNESGQGVTIDVYEEGEVEEGEVEEDAPYEKIANPLPDVKADIPDDNAKQPPTTVEFESMPLIQQYKSGFQGIHFPPQSTQSPTLDIQDTSKQIDETDLREYLSKFGEILNLTWSKENGNGNVSYSSLESLNTVFAKPEHAVNSIHIMLSPAPPTIDPELIKKYEASYAGFGVHIRSILHEMTEEIIKTEMSCFGVVTEIRLFMKPKEDAPFGYGFVMFASPKHAARAIACGSHLILGNEVKIGQMKKENQRKLSNSGGKSSAKVRGGRGASRGNRESSQGGRDNRESSREGGRGKGKDLNEAHGGRGRGGRGNRGGRGGRSDGQTGRGNRGDGYGGRGGRGKGHSERGGDRGEGHGGRGSRGDDRYQQYQGGRSESFNGGRAGPVFGGHRGEFSVPSYAHPQAQYHAGPHHSNDPYGRTSQHIAPPYNGLPPHPAPYRGAEPYSHQIPPQQHGAEPYSHQLPPPRHGAEPHPHQLPPPRHGEPHPHQLPLPRHGAVPYSHQLPPPHHVGDPQLAYSHQGGYDVHQPPQQYTHQQPYSHHQGHPPPAQRHPYPPHASNPHQLPAYNPTPSYNPPPYGHEEQNHSRYPPMQHTPPPLSNQNYNGHVQPPPTLQGYAHHDVYRHEPNQYPTPGHGQAAHSRGDPRYGATKSRSHNHRSAPY